MRVPNTTIGELAVTVGPDYWFFRPSLAAISQLGTPEGIVHVYASVMGEFSWTSFLESVGVLWACCTEGDASLLTGYIRSYGKWAPGKLPPEDVHVLAQCLLKHGITSNVKPTRKTESSDYTAEFVAADCAALAMAHLGLSEQDAWQLTMTGFVRAMRAKFPDGSPTEAQKEQRIKEADETMDWLAAVNAARGK